MGLLSQAADTAYAFRFLKLFVTPFDKTVAFELGIIDEKGKNLRKYRDLGKREEKRRGNRRTNVPENKSEKNHIE